jgi:hypothetical protein
MHGIVKLLIEVGEGCDDNHINKMMEDGVVYTVTVLASLLFSHCPSSMALDRGFDFPRYTLYSGSFLAYMLVNAVYFSLKGYLNNRQECSKVIRPIIPILSFVLQNISRNYEELIEDFEVQEFLRKSVYLEFILIDQSNDHPSFETNVNLLVSSKFFDRLITVFEKSTSEKCCFAGLMGPCAPLKDCIIFRGVVTIMQALGKYRRSKSLSVAERIERLLLMKRILDDKRLFREDGPALIEGDISMMVISSEVVKLGSLQCQQLFRKPEDNFLSTMVNFASRNPACLNYTCLAVLKILEACEIHDIFDYLVPLPSLCLNHILTHNDLTRRDINLLNSASKLNTLEISSEQTYGLMKDLIPITTFRVFDAIVCSATFDQLQQLESQYSITNLIVRVLKKSKNSGMLLGLMDIFNDLVDKHQLSFLDAGSMMKIIPVLWKKLKMSEEVEGAVVSFTYRISLFLAPSCCLDYTAFVPIILQDVHHIHHLKPQNPGLFKLTWELTRFRKHKQLFKKLDQLSADKTVEYFSPGNFELARIFKLISDLIIEYVENEPPFNTKYLIDLTRCMVVIARSSSLDEELYVLEDMVSPAMWLLEKQNDEKIVANVKEFISILH